MKILTAPLFALIALTLTACSTPNPYGQPSTSYVDSETNQSLNVTYATVIDVQAVTIDSEGNLVGKTAGGLIGGIAGSSIGGGRGSAAAAVAGAVMGGMIGNKAEAMYNTANGVQITVQTNTGRALSVIQEANINVIYSKGDSVKVITAADGKTRIIQ